MQRNQSDAPAKTATPHREDASLLEDPRWAKLACERRRARKLPSNETGRHDEDVPFAAAKRKVRGPVPFDIASHEPQSHLAKEMFDANQIEVGDVR
jgi:hypothetical protein